MPLAPACLSVCLSVCFQASLHFTPLHPENKSVSLSPPPPLASVFPWDLAPSLAVSGTPSGSLCISCMCTQTKPGTIQPLSRARPAPAAASSPGRDSPNPFQLAELGCSTHSSVRNWVQASSLGRCLCPHGCTLGKAAMFLPMLSPTSCFSPQPQAPRPPSPGEIPVCAKQAYKAFAAVPVPHLPLEPEVSGGGGGRPWAEILGRLSCPCYSAFLFLRRCRARGARRSPRPPWR